MSKNNQSTCKVISTDRHGGVSHAPYESLNLSYGVNDDTAFVTENRNRIKKRHSINHLLYARQVHGDTIFIARESLNKDTEIEGCDALMTDIPDIGLMIQQADCQAVTLFDPAHPAIAAIHCGWKGSVLNILAKTVRSMTDCYGSSPSTLQATISPSLGPCCAEFVNHATELPPSFLAFQVKENYFDFWQISKMQLTEAGLDENKIKIAGQCTSCSPDYFSYRRACHNSNGNTGRCATMISL
ncbi:MAG: peptidoglycan editing factor PgeF [Thermodesulfobacteriota bacterium]|nr:peptidoglycan editing factor PgeF [Thermodesulfobacteriota bacterium]